MLLRYQSVVTRLLLLTLAQYTVLVTSSETTFLGQRLNVPGAFDQEDLVISRNIRQDNNVYYGDGKYKGSNVHIICNTILSRNQNNKEIQVYTDIMSKAPIASLGNQAKYLPSIKHSFPIDLGKCFIVEYKCDRPLTSQLITIGSSSQRERDTEARRIFDLVKQGVANLENIGWIYMGSIYGICFNNDNTIVLRDFSNAASLDTSGVSGRALINLKDENRRLLQNQLDSMFNDIISPPRTNRNRSRTNRNRGGSPPVDLTFPELSPAQIFRHNRGSSQNLSGARSQANDENGIDNPPPPYESSPPPYEHPPSYSPPL
ncbi:hypothetical protein BDF19DRAFT_418855 [Syncephalis fuscata]|nr:hypothetical protein BDF19DRAFT_418855 [Syncephalis fuscata]